jgi:hypothetical protein
MPTKVPETKLRERGSGYELSGFEQTMIFQKEDRGYVRWRNKSMGMYYLDPSPFENTPYKELYISPLKNLPPKDQFIKVTVMETDVFKDVNPVTGEVIQIDLKFVSGFEIRDPNEIRGNRLLNPEEFVNAAALPISDKNLPFEQIKECLGMYMVASPKVSEIEQGGINTVILGDTQTHNKWVNFQRMTSIIPSEFRYVASKKYYKAIESGAVPKAKNCEEVSLAFLNREDVPIQIPMPFDDLEFKPYMSYKEDFMERKPMARAFLLDSLLYTPEISFSLRRRVEEQMVFMVEDTLASEDLPCYQDVGSAATRLTLSVARLNFQQFASLQDMKKGVSLWYDAMDKSKRDMQRKGAKGKNFNKKANTPNADLLFSVIEDLNDRGIPLTRANVFACAMLPEYDFEEAIFKLKMQGKIYFPEKDLIALIKGFWTK